MSKPLQEYVHREFNEEIMAIGGRYKFTDEVRLPFQGNQLLYLKGYAVFDTTCCGAGGCSYILVKGFIKQWKTAKADDGLFISWIKLIEEPDLRIRITQHLKKKEMVQQVQFA